MQPKKGFFIVMSIIRYGVENAADFSPAVEHYRIICFQIVS